MSHRTAARARFAATALVMAVGLAIQLEVALTADKADTVFDTTPVALALGAAALDRRLGRRGRQAVMAEPMTPDPAAG